MTDGQVEPDAEQPADLAPASPPVRRRRWQWSMATLLLLTAAIAAWTAFYGAKQQAERYRREIATMETLARRLRVDDPTRYAVVKQLQTWKDDHRWEVYLPPGDTYSLRLVTREIDARNFPASESLHSLAPGQYQISFDGDGEMGKSTDIEVTVDGQPAISLRETADWQTGSGWMETGGYHQASQFSLRQPLELMRRQFMVKQPDGSSRSTIEPNSGVLLWIESSQVEKPAEK